MKKTKKQFYPIVGILFFLSLLFGFAGKTNAMTSSDCYDAYLNCMENCESAYSDCMSSVSDSSSANNQADNNNSCSGGISGSVYNASNGTCECPSGQSINWSNYSCESGSGSNNNSGQNSCSGGFVYNESRGVCECPVGKFLNQSTFSCEDVTCPDGTYIDYGSGLCRDGSGNVVSATNTTSNASGYCPDGTYLDTSDAKCKDSSGKVKCPAGQYIDFGDGYCKGQSGAVSYASDSNLTGGATVASVVTDNYNSGAGSSSGLPNVTGVGDVSIMKCGTGFEDIGGVCFPTTTGLSNAPIYVIISNLFSWLMGLFTTLAVLAFVISGIQYLTSAGDKDQAETAKKNAINAILGIIVGLSGFVIVKAIAAALSGQSIFF